MNGKRGAQQAENPELDQYGLRISVSKKKWENGTRVNGQVVVINANKQTTSESEKQKSDEFKAIVSYASTF